jgi:5-formyltetrahydrofolate cyclo-ligase
MNPDWPTTNAWRKERRVALRAARLGLSPARRRDVQARVLAHLEAGLPELRAAGAAPVAFYWPFRGEVDPLPLMRRHVEAGGRAALPVVVRRNAPVEFWEWTPATRMVPGVWDIPVPAERHPLAPALVLVPLLGFDDAGYRLGNGGGYYDRTLAALDPCPPTIGVGCALGRLETIQPQPHDVPLDAVVTEAGLRWSPLAAPGGVGPSSPVCYADEAAPEYFGHLSAEDTRALLRRLRRAALGALRQAGEAPVQGELPDVPAALRAARESTLAARLLAHCALHTGDDPTAEPTIESDPASAEPMAAVYTALREALPRLRDEAVHAALAALLEVPGSERAGALP